MKAFLIGYPVAVFIAVLGAVAAQFDYSEVDWPAWVQAVGSIGAILVAVFVSWWQGRQANRLHLREQMAERNRMLSGLRAIADHAHEVLDNAFVCVRADPPTRRGYLEFTYDDRNFQYVESALAAIPLHELGNGGLVTGVVGMREATTRASQWLASVMYDPDFNRNDEDEAFEILQQIVDLERVSFQLMVGDAALHRA